MHNPSYRMQMTADFAGITVRFVAESQGANFQLPVKRATDTTDRFWIMIARNPNPVAAPLERAQIVAIAVTEPTLATGVSRSLSQSRPAPPQSRNLSPRATMKRGA